MAILSVPLILLCAIVAPPPGMAPAVLSAAGWDWGEQAAATAQAARTRLRRFMAGSLKIVNA